MKQPFASGENKRLIDIRLMSGSCDRVIDLKSTNVPKSGGRWLFTVRESIGDLLGSAQIYRVGLKSYITLMQMCLRVG